MTATAPSDLTPVLIVLGILVVVLARRTYAMVTGTRYSIGRLFGFTAFYVFLFGVLAFSTLYGAVASWGLDAIWLVLPYVVAGALVVAEPYVRRIVRFERRDHGSWYYRLPLLVPVLYLGLFVLRFGAEILLFGVSAATSFLLPTSLPTGLLVTLVAIDLLFGVSVGLLLGRAIGVYRAFGKLSAVPENTPPLVPR